MLPCTFKVYLDVITLALNLYHILYKLSFEIMFIFCGSVLYSIVVQSTVLNKKKLFSMFIYHEAYLTCGMLGKQVLVVTSICKWVTHSLRCRHCGDKRSQTRLSQSNCALMIVRLVTVSTQYCCFKCHFLSKPKKFLVKAQTQYYESLPSLRIWCKTRTTTDRLHSDVKNG